MYDTKTYCKRGYFCWGKISRKCWQDLSCGGNFHYTFPISFIKAYGFYFRVGVIFAKKTKSQKRENYPHANISMFIVILWILPLPFIKIPFQEYVSKDISHPLIYDDLLTNAGEQRKRSDSVLLRKPLYQQKIQTKLMITIQYLQKISENAAIANHIGTVLPVW